MKPRRGTAILATLLAFFMTLEEGRTARACPNCKEAVSLQSGEAANVANGYNWSVLFMIAVPFSLMGTGALAIRRAAKRGVLPEL
jgi:hypothetical protein